MERRQVVKLPLSVVVSVVDRYRINFERIYFGISTGCADIKPCIGLTGKYEIGHGEFPVIAEYLDA